MFYCKNCDYSLEISKNNNPELDVTQIIDINNPERLVKIVLKNEKAEQDIQYNIKFNEKELKDYLDKLEDIDDDQKDEILGRFEQIIKHQKNISKFFFICNNCSTSYVLQPNTIVYSINFDKSTGGMIEEDVNIKIQDPILPRTKDYICPNKNCESRSDNSKKEAIFYRNGKDYHLRYVCTICKTQWDV